MYTVTYSGRDRVDGEGEFGGRKRGEGTGASFGKLRPILGIADSLPR